MGVTEQVEKSILKAWNECINDDNNEVCVDKILDKFLNGNNGEKLNTSGILLNRFFQANLSGKIDKTILSSTSTLASNLARNKKFDYYKIESNPKKWEKILDEGFTQKQRLYIFKIAICSQMDNKEFLKLLNSVDGETVNFKNPTDIIYFYSYKRGYTLSKADNLIKRYNILHNSKITCMPLVLQGASTKDMDEKLLEDLAAGFTKEESKKQFIDFLENKEGNSDKTETMNDSDYQMYSLSDYLENILSDVMPVGLEGDEKIDFIIEYILEKEPNILVHPPKSYEAYKETIKKWILMGIRKKINAFRLGIAIPEMSFNDYLRLLYSIDGKAYDFSNTEYCLYYYCKKMGYNLKKTDSMRKRLFYKVNAIGLTNQFEDIMNPSIEEEVADEILINELIAQDEKMNNASIHNIAKFARLSQYVAVKYSKNAGPNSIKMNYNNIFPQGAQLYKAVYGGGLEGQETHGKGEGVFYDFVAKYFKDYGNRLKDKYDVLMCNTREDLRYNNVRRMEVMGLLFPLMIDVKDSIDTNKLAAFKCNTDEKDETNWEEEIQHIWNDFDVIMDEMLNYNKLNVFPLIEKAKKNRKNKEELNSILDDLLKAYIESYNIVLKEFGFEDIYLPYIGDRFFLLNLLAHEPLGIENNLAYYSIDFSKWETVFDDN